MKKAILIYTNKSTIKLRNSKKHSIANEMLKVKDIIETSGDTTKEKGKHPETFYYTRGKRNISRQLARGASLQNIMREIRQTITEDYYYDIDMVNSEPTLLLNYCKKSKYPFDAIKYYCDNREKCLSELIKKHKITRQEAKTVVLAIINGSNDVYETPWLIKFACNVKNIHKLIEENPAYTNKLEIIKSCKKFNPIGTLVSEIFHEIENKCLLSCEELLTNDNVPLTNVIPMCDGLMIPKKHFTLKPSWFDRLSQYVYSKTGYEVSFTNKKMDEVIDLSGLVIDINVKFIAEKLIADDDDKASEFLLNELDGQIFYCNNQIWIRTMADRIYVSEETQIIAEMKSRCRTLHIERSGKHPVYSANESGASSIVKCAINKVVTLAKYRDENFVTRMTAFMVDKIFFIDGYITCGEKIKFIVEQDYEDYDVMTTIRIQRNLPNLDQISKKTTLELITRVLLPIFGTQELITNYLQHIARAITGHIEDKDWVILTGMRNCGKGVLTILNKHTFECYSCETSANAFLIEKQHSVEDPKKYAWLYQNRWTRLLISSEVKYDPTDNNIKIDGNLLKGKLNSGGDYIEVRDLYMKAIKIIPQCRLFMMCNDVPPISPPDALQTVSKFTFPSQFEREDKYEIMKKEGTLTGNIYKEDPDIKDFVRRRDICDCFLKLVLDAYTTKRVINCAKVKEDSDTLRADMGDENALISQHFTFTGSKNDYILSSDLIAFHRANHLNISLNKLRDLLLFKGARVSTHIGLDKKSRGYIGVLIKVNDE